MFCESIFDERDDCITFHLGRELDVGGYRSLFLTTGVIRIGGYTEGFMVFNSILFSPWIKKKNSGSLTSLWSL